MKLPNNPALMYGLLVGAVVVSFAGGTIVGRGTSDAQSQRQELAILDQKIADANGQLAEATDKRQAEEAAFSQDQALHDEMLTDVPGDTEYPCKKAVDLKNPVQMTCADKNGREVASLEFTFDNPADPGYAKGASLVWSFADGTKKAFQIQKFWSDTDIPMCTIDGIYDRDGVLGTSVTCETGDLSGYNVRNVYAFDEKTGLAPVIECVTKPVSSMGDHPLITTSTLTCKNYSLPQ